MITAALLVVMEIACRLFGLNRFADSDFRFFIRNVDNDLRLDYVVEDPLLMWSLKPGYQDPYVTISGQGFRDIEYGMNKSDGVFRILCLGDSSTFGFGMPLEATYHALLEDRLNREHGGDGRRFEVINAGVVGYTSIQGLTMYLSRGIQLKPDLVTFYFGVNETVRRFYLGDAEIMKTGRPRWLNILVNGWLLKSELVRMVQKTASGVIGGSSGDARPPVARVARADYRESILQLKEVCARNGARLLLISPALHMNPNVLDGRAMEIIQYRKILDLTAAEAGIPLLTVPEMTEYASEDSDYLFLEGDSVHPSQTGQWLLMQRLHDFMIHNRMLK